MNSDQVQQMNDGLLAGMIGRGEGIDITGDVIHIGNDELRLGDEPLELWKMQVDETGWLVGLLDHPQMWGVLDRLTPGVDVLVSLDPNFPGFVDVFEPLGVTRAGQLPRLGKGVLLGWNDECQDVVRPLNEIPADEWQAAASCPPMAEVYGRDTAGRVAVFLREQNGGWFAIANGLPNLPVGPVVEWCYMGAAEEPGLEVLTHTTAERALSAQKSPSDASDGCRVGDVRGEALQSAPTPARSSAAAGGV